MCCVYIYKYIYRIYVYMSIQLSLGHDAVAQIQDEHCEVLNMKTNHGNAYAVRCYDLYISQQTPITLNAMKAPTC